MSETGKPIRPLKPERPSPMMASETPLTLKGVLEVVTPRWAKRLMRRGRST